MLTLIFHFFRNTLGFFPYNSEGLIIRTVSAYLQQSWRKYIYCNWEKRVMAAIVLHGLAFIIVTSLLITTLRSQPDICMCGSFLRQCLESLQLDFD